MDELKKDIDVKMDQRMQQIMKGFEAMLTLRLPVDQNRAGNRNDPMGSILGSINSGGNNGKDGISTNSGNSNNIFKSIRFEFPKFDETNPRSWIRRCNKLFAHYVVDEEQKLYLATINLEGEAEEWYAGFVPEGVTLTWTGFVDEILARFGPEAQSNPIGELKNLHQVGTVDEYRRKFEELKG